MMKSKLFGWIDERTGAEAILKSQLTEYQVPKNLNYMWNFGSLALLVLVLQIPHRNFPGHVLQTIGRTDLRWLYRGILIPSNASCAMSTSAG